jgi:hypothetical protein
VSVGQADRHRPAGELDHPRVGAGQRAHLGVVADRQHREPRTATALTRG